MLRGLLLFCARPLLSFTRLFLLLRAPSIARFFVLLRALSAQCCAPFSSFARALCSVFRGFLFFCARSLLSVARFFVLLRASSAPRFLDRLRVPFSVLRGFLFFCARPLLSAPRFLDRLRAPFSVLRGLLFFCAHPLLTSCHIFITLLRYRNLQVTVDCAERGEILADLRKRYGGLLDRVPRQVKRCVTSV